METLEAKADPELAIKLPPQEEKGKGRAEMSFG